MDQAVQIQKITQTTQLDMHGKTVPALSIQFMVGTHGPFTEVIEKDKFDPATAKQKLATFAQGLTMLGTTGY